MLENKEKKVGPKKAGNSMKRERGLELGVEDQGEKINCVRK